MDNENTPHESWAEVYDIAYEEAFGKFYTDLSKRTIEIITNNFSKDTKIIDYGAGTGRLAIPLAELGFDVTAVEPSASMIEKLLEKSKELSIQTIQAKMEDVDTQDEFDLALCVFTVLLYLLDENTLHKSFSAVYNSLKQDAFLILDIPTKDLFQGYSFSNNVVKRIVNIKEVSNELYEYQEDLTVISQSQISKNYSDTFPIKYWSTEKVLSVLENIGFVVVEDLSMYFLGSGSKYFLLQKQGTKEANDRLQ